MLKTMKQKKHIFLVIYLATYDRPTAERDYEVAKIGLCSSTHLVLNKFTSTQKFYSNNCLRKSRYSRKNTIMRLGYYSEVDFVQIACDVREHEQKKIS